MSDWSLVEEPQSEWSLVPDQPAPEPKKSFLERAGEGVSALGRGVGALGSTIWSPLDTIRDPAKRRQLARGFSDTVTFGLAEKAGERVEKQIGGMSADYAKRARAIVAGLPPELRAQMEQQIAEYESNVAGEVGEGGGWAQTRQADQEAAPDYRTGGAIAGAFVPGGAAGAAGKAGVAAARKILPLAATTRLGSAGLGLARGLIGYEATAPAMAATQSAIAGDKPVDILKSATDAAQDPLGLILSGGGGALGGLAKGQAQRYRDPKTIEGRTVAAVEHGGGKIKPFGEPVRPVAPGAVAEVEGMGLPKGREGMNQLAGQSRDAMKSHNRQLLKDARAQYGADVDGVLAEHAGQPTVAKAAHAALDTLEAENTLSSGKPVSSAMAKKLKELRSQLSTEGDPAVDIGDLIKMKKSIADRAEWGRPATAKNRKYRVLTEALNEDAASIDPRIAEINKAYAGKMSQLEEANDILFGSRNKNVPKSAAKDKSAALKLGRIGDDTQAGTTDRLGRLGELDPAYAEQLRLLEAKKAMERLRYGEPEVSTSIEKGMGRAAQRAVPAAIGGAVGGLPGAMAGAAAGSAVANPIALKLRLGLPAAEAGGRFFTGSSGTLMDRLMALQRQREEEQKRMAGMLTQ